MKSLRTPKPATTPAGDKPTTPQHGGATPDPERAPLTLVDKSSSPAAPGTFKSFEGDPKAEAKTLLQTLEIQAATYPQFAAILALSIEPLKLEVRRTKSDRDLVLEVLTNFHSVEIEEFCDDTHLSVARICEALRNLLELKLVECREAGRRSGTKLDPSVRALLEHVFTLATHKHLKGDYRVAYIFCLSNLPAASTYSSPPKAHSSTQAMSTYLQD